jgi:hypothetical protein
MFGGREPYIYTGADDESYDKYGLTAEDLSVLISPTVLSPQGQPMSSPHDTQPQESSGSSSTAEPFFFDVNDLPSLGSEDHNSFFGLSQAIMTRDGSTSSTTNTALPPALLQATQNASMPPPVPLHPKMPTSRDKKTKETQAKVCFFV